MDDPVEVALAWIDAWNRGDTDRFLAMLAPDAEWRDRPEFPDAGVYQGREAIGRHIQRLVEGVRVTWEPVSSQRSGDRVLLHTRLRMHGEGSGLDVVDDVHAVVTVRGGLVVRRENYSTPDEARRALGGP